jgi:hypothetical protein
MRSSMAAIFTLAAQKVKSLFAIDRFNTVALDIILAAMQHVADLS